MWASCVFHQGVNDQSESEDPRLQELKTDRQALSIISSHVVYTTSRNVSHLLDVLKKKHQYRQAMLSWMSRDLAALAKLLPFIPRLARVRGLGLLTGVSLLPLLRRLLTCASAVRCYRCCAASAKQLGIASGQ